MVVYSKATNGFRLASNNDGERERERPTQREDEDDEEEDKEEEQTLTTRVRVCARVCLQKRRERERHVHTSKSQETPDEIKHTRDQKRVITMPQKIYYYYYSRGSLEDQLLSEYQQKNAHEHVETVSLACHVSSLSQRIPMYLTRRRTYFQEDNNLY